MKMNPNKEFQINDKADFNAKSWMEDF